MAPPSPYDDPVPRGWKFVQGTLRVAVCVQCAGLAALHLRSGQPSQASEVIGHLLGLSEASSSRLASLAGYGVGLCGLVLLLRPNWPMLLGVALWFAAESAGQVIDDVNVLGLLEQLTRVALPVALLLVEFWPPRLSFSIGRAKAALLILRWSAVISVAAGGLLKLMEIATADIQLELLRVAVDRGGWTASEAQLLQALAVMVAVDLTLAANFLLSRSRIGAALFTGWLMASAAVWIAARGGAGYAPFLLHASAAGAPLAVLLFWVCAVKEQPPIIVPGNG